MDEERFAAISGILDQNANRSRIVFYFFVLINASLFLYALNAFVYNFPRERLKEYTSALICATEKPLSNHCRNLLSQVDVNIPPDGGSSHDIALERVKHNQNTYIDEIAMTRRFTFPIFGFSVDIDYFWLIGGLVGVLTLFVLAAALANEAELFRYLLQQNTKDAERTRMLLATQVLTSPADYKGDELRGVFPFIKNLMLISIIAMPILSSLFRLSYDLHLSDLLNQQASYSDVTAALIDDFVQRPWLSTASLLTQVMSIATEFWLLQMILMTLKAISDSYHSARLKVLQLESPVTTPPS